MSGPQNSQLPMFDLAPPRFPRTRRGDPRSSQDAATAIEESGRAKTQALRVLRALRRYPNSTSMELAKASRIDRYAVARRLPELATANLVKRYEPTKATAPCVVSKKRVCRWSPV